MPHAVCYQRNYSHQTEQYLKESKEKHNRLKGKPIQIDLMGHNNWTITNLFVFTYSQFASQSQKWKDALIGRASTSAQTLNKEQIELRQKHFFN